MPIYLSAKYYKITKKGFEKKLAKSIKIFLKKIKTKRENMVA